MLNYHKIESIEDPLENSIQQFKTKDIIKFNLGLAYFIILTFLIIKLLFT